MEPIVWLAVLGPMLLLGLWLKPLWHWHKPLAAVCLGLQLGSAAAFVFREPGLWSAAYTATAFYQIVNLARVAADRIQADFLKRTSLRSGLILTGFQVLFGLLGSNPKTYLSRPLALTALVAAQLLLCLMLFLSTQRHLRTTKMAEPGQPLADRDLPSVSVLLPARDETDELTRSLEQLLASDYPKLEIIVLDDCSQNRRTSEIIRGYAQAGVRFIAGEAPPANWLARNYAYQQLFEAGSGDYLLFCGVDLEVAPGAIRLLIGNLLAKNKQMLSVLPHNQKPLDIRSYIVQPVRYAWEICLPRRLFNRPPVLSTCWLVQRRRLESLGGFKGTSRSISPESYLARSIKSSDGYSFIRSDQLVSNKPLADQLATTLRQRYPQLHRRPELVLALSLIEVVGLVLPLPLAVAAWLHGIHALALSALAAYMLSVVMFMELTSVMYGRVLKSCLWLAPMAALYDALLINYSMYRYEFGTVDWKGRNVCLPVMRYDQPESVQAPAVPHSAPQS